MWKSATTAADFYQRFECGRMLSSATTAIVMGAVDVMRYRLTGALEMYEEQRCEEMASLEAQMYDILTDVKDAVTKAEAEFDLDLTTSVDLRGRRDSESKSNDTINVGENISLNITDETLSSFQSPRFGLDVATRELAAEVARQGSISKLVIPDDAAVSNETQLPSGECGAPENDVQDGVSRKVADDQLVTQQNFAKNEVKRADDLHQDEVSRLIEGKREKEEARLEVNYQEEEAKLAEEKCKNKEAKVAAEKHQEEATTGKASDEKRLEDAAKVAEAKRQEGETRVAEEKRRGEEARVAEERLQEEAARVAEEKRREEEARVAEERLQDSARIAEEKRREEEARVAAEKLQEEAARVAEEKRREEEARVADEKLQEEAVRIAEEQRQEEAARVAEEKRQEAMRQEQDARYTKEKRQVELARLADEKRQEDEARVAAFTLVEEEARLAEEKRTEDIARLAEEDRTEEKARLAQAHIVVQASKGERKEDNFRRVDLVDTAVGALDDETADEDAFLDDEWEASVRLALQLDGALPDDDEIDLALDDWDAANRLAKKLATTDMDDDDFLAMTPEKLAEQAYAAREAVALFEAERLQGARTKERIWQERTKEIGIQEGDLDLPDNPDFSYATDEMMNLEELGKLARREAVDQFEASFDDALRETDQRHATDRIDWSVLTIANLRTEMKKRGLNSTGTKTKLVFALQEYEAKRVRVDEGDVNELKVGVVQKSVSRSDSKPVYEGATASVSAIVDFEAMTVAQLKEELKARGLKVGGKKSELIDRLAAL